MSTFCSLPELGWDWGIDMDKELSAASPTFTSLPQETDATAPKFAATIGGQKP